MAMTVGSGAVGASYLYDPNSGTYYTKVYSEGGGGKSRLKKGGSLGTITWKVVPSIPSDVKRVAWGSPDGPLQGTVSRFEADQHQRSYVRPSGGGGSGGYGGWGGGGGGLSREEALRLAAIDMFDQYYAGDVPQVCIDKFIEMNGMDAEGVRRFAYANGANSKDVQTEKGLVVDAIEQATGSRDVADEYITKHPDLINTIAGWGWTGEKLQSYILDLPGIDATQGYMGIEAQALWSRYTGGLPLSYRAKQKLQELLKTFNGYSPDAATAWEAWLKTTDSARTGTYGDTIRDQIIATYEAVFGREPTEAELEQGGQVWNLVANTSSIDAVNDTALRTHLRETDEYKTRYPYGTYGMSEEAYQAGLTSLERTLQRHSGTILPEGMMQMDTAKEGALPASVSFDEEKNKYYQINDEGDRVYLTDKQVADLRAVPESPTGLSNADTMAIYDDMQQNGWSTEDLEEGYRIQEQAQLNRADLADTMMEAYGIELSDAEWIAYSDPGNALHAEIRNLVMEAQNREGFRELFRQYTGRDPEPEDYDALTAEYVSPAEYGREMQEREDFTETFRQYKGRDPSEGELEGLTMNFMSPAEYARQKQAEYVADSMYPETKDLLKRVFGKSLSKQQLVDMALKREGTGELQALIDQATRLDQYTELWRVKYGTDPTAKDYASLVGYASPAELEWEIVTAEKVDEMRDDVNELMQKHYGYEMTDDDLTVMFGNMVGSGDLKAQLKKAEEMEKDWEVQRNVAFNAQRAEQPWQQAAQGGFKMAMPALPSLN